MPNLEIPKLNIHPEPTPEQMKSILREQERLEKTLLGIKAETTKRNFKLQDNGLYSMEPVKIIDPSTDPMMQIVDPQGNPVSSKTLESTPEAVTPVAEIKIEEPEEIEEVVEESAEEPEEEEEIPAPAAPIAKVEVTPTPVDPKQVELEQVVARIREYNKNNTPLSAEDLKYRRENWGKVEVALMDLHKKEKVANPEPEVVHNFIEHTGPNLERSRADYALAIFNNRKALYENKQWKKSGDGVESETLDPANQEYLKSLQKKYNDNVETELAKVKPENMEGGARIAMTRARLEFLEDERNKFNNEVFLLENEETKKRIGKALDKAFTKTGEVVGKTSEVLGKGVGSAAELLGKGVNNILDRFKNKKGKKKGDGMPWWYYAAMIPASPTALGVWAGDQLHKGLNNTIDLLKKKFNQGMNPEKKPSLKEKYGNKRPYNEAAPAERELTEEEVKIQKEKEQKEKEINDRKTEFIEKAFDGKLEGDNLKKWKKLSNLSIGAFFHPEEKLRKKVTDYPVFAQKIYEKLLPLYQKEPASKTGDKVELEAFITKLAEQDKLKDLWTQTSNSNS